MLKKIGLTFVLLLVLTVTPTFIPLGSLDQEQEIEFYLISNDIHIGLVLPLKNEVFDWESLIDPKQFGSRPTKWLNMGWGDRQFYFAIPTWDNFSIGVALDSLFVPDPGILHIEYLPLHPERYKGIRKIKVSKRTYAKIVSAVKDSFILKDGRPVLIDNRGYEDNDNFYEAHGTYTILRTCNEWTADMLGEAGLPRPLWSPTKYGLEFLYREFR